MSSARTRTATASAIPRPKATAFGQNDAEFNIFNTDRQLAALQTAVTMLRPLPEQKSLIYFASGLRLNGTDNKAQLRATTNAAIRANVHDLSRWTRAAWWPSAPLGDATQRSPGGIGMFTGQLARPRSSRLPAVAGHALLARQGHRRQGDVRLQRPVARHRRRRREALTSYYIIGYYSTHTANDGKFRRVQGHAAPTTVDGELAYRQGYFADKEFAKFTGADEERQLEEALMLENPVTDITIAMEVNYFQLNRAEYFVPVAVKIPGSELALARRARRAAHDARLHRRGEGRLRHHAVRTCATSSTSR